MKTIKLVLIGALVALLGSSAWAIDKNVRLVGTEPQSVTSPSQVTKSNYYKYVLGNGASNYVSTGWGFRVTLGYGF